MVSKRQRAFALFDEGKTPSSPEVRALKLRGNVKYNYYQQWKHRAKGSGADGSVIPEKNVITPVIKETDLVGVGLDESEANTVKGESSVIEGVVVDESENNTGENKVAIGEGESSEEHPGDDGDGKKPLKRVVRAQGLTFQVVLSTKTLQLYQIAASMQDIELTLGDFIDTCVEDFFRGRGYDLGLIKVGGSQNG